MNNPIQRLIIKIALWLNYHFVGKKLVQPPMKLENGMPNQDWLVWYEKRFLFSRSSAMLAYDTLTAELNDPAFFIDRKDWTKKFVENLFKNYNGSLMSEEELERVTTVTVMAIMVKGAEAMEKGEPKIFNSTETLINIDWVHWYTDVSGGTFYRSWLFAMQRAAAKGKLICKLYLPA